MSYRGLAGQSAIEYLMTYGWMLLVVAIVGGAVFSVVQSESIESVSGFTGEDVVVENFGLSQSGSLDFVLRNGGAEEIEINSVEVLDEEGDQAYVYPSESLAVGGSSSVSVPNVVESSGSNSLDLRVSYDMDGLTDLSVEGSVSGSIGIEPEVWEGDVDGDGSVESAEFYGGGSSVSPYRVGSVEGLQMMSQETGSSFELGSDIDASGTSSWNGGSGFDPIGSFSGSLDGEGYTIGNLTINRPAKTHVGVFSTVNNDGVIEKIHVNNATIYGEREAGAIVGDNSGTVLSCSATEIYTNTSDGRGSLLVGFNSGGTIERCGSSGEIKDTVGNEIGGVTGYNSGGVLRDVYARVNITHDQNFQVAGITGVNIDTGVIENAYAVTNIDGNNNYQVEGLIGDERGGTVNNLYLDVDASNQNTGVGTELSTSGMTGDSAADNLEGFDFQNVWRTVDGDYPKIR